MHPASAFVVGQPHHCKAERRMHSLTLPLRQLAVRPPQCRTPSPRCPQAAQAEPGNSARPTRAPPAELHAWANAPHGLWATVSVHHRVRRNGSRPETLALCIPPTDCADEPQGKVLLPRRVLAPLCSSPLSSSTLHKISELGPLAPGDFRVVHDLYQLEPPDSRDELIAALRQEGTLRAAQEGRRPAGFGHG